MPRFYFDFEDGGIATQDDEGLELAGVDDARQEALNALAGIAKDEVPKKNEREFVMTVREGLEPVLIASLSLRIERKRA